MSHQLEALETDTASDLSFVEAGCLTQSINTLHSLGPGSSPQWHPVGTCDTGTNTEKPSRPEKLD